MQQPEQPPVCTPRFLRYCLISACTRPVMRMVATGHEAPDGGPLMRRLPVKKKRYSNCGTQHGSGNSQANTGG